MPQSSNVAIRARARRRRRSRGQALIEYTLLLAFVALAAAGILQTTGNSSAGIWSTANSQLDKADSSLSATPTPNGGHHDHDGGDHRGFH